MTKAGGGWAAVKNTTQFVDFLRRDVPGPGPAIYLTTGVYGSFDFMVCAHGKSPTSTCILCSLFSDALDTPRMSYFPRPRAREAAAGRYRALFAAFGIHSQDTFPG